MKFYLGIVLFLIGSILLILVLKDYLNTEKKMDWVALKGSFKTITGSIIFVVIGLYLIIIS